MRKFNLIILIIILSFILGCASEYTYRGDVYVKGYYRKDGTYVKSHTRTRPDSIRSNNKSYKRK